MKKLVLGLVAVAVLAMVSAPVMAATEWNFGGMMRFMTFWDQNNGGKGEVADFQNGGASMKSDGRLQWGTQTDTRIMMFMKSDSLDGFIEMGWDTGENKVFPREYWGRYKFNDKASIIVGQQHQLYNAFISNQVGLNGLEMHGIGTPFRPPTPKIVFNYGGVGHIFFLHSGFSFALVQPEAETYYEWDATVPTQTADVDTYLPQIQASYSYYADAWRVKIGAAYQHTKWNKIAALSNSKNKNVNSWLVTVDGDVAFGPLLLAASVTAGQNWGNAGMMNSEFGNAYGESHPMTYRSIASGQFDATTGKWKNTTSLMASVVAGYQLTEALRFEAGAGYRYDDNKVFTKESNLWSLYLQAAYTVAPGFQIVPEIGYIDRCKDPRTGEDDGYLWYAGAQWRMFF